MRLVFRTYPDSMMARKGADRRVPPAYPGVAEADQDRSRTEVRPRGPAYPQPRRAGSAVPRLLPLRGLPDLPGPDRRLGRLPGAAHHQEVWQATGLAAKRHHDTAYAVFHSAAWEWDDLGVILATLILTHLVPGGVVWVAVDDTLCHKRGAKVAFGGIFLDAVLASTRHKTFR